MTIRTAEIKDLPALLEIYNYEVLNGTATFDTEPKTLAQREEWFYAHNVDNYPLIVAELEDLGRQCGALGADGKLEDLLA